MTNNFDGSTFGAHPGMSPDEAAKRLRAHEQPLGKQDPVEEKSPLGWTEDKQGETLPGEQPHAGGAPEQPHGSAPAYASAEQPLPEPGQVPVVATPAYSPTGFDADAGGNMPSPSINTAARAFVTADLGSAALPATDLVPVGGDASALLTPHASGRDEGSSPLLAAGDLAGSVIEDSQHQISGHLSVSGGEAGAAVQWQALAPDGVYGQLQVAPDGRWLYTPNETSPAFQGLNEGQHVIEEFLVRASSGHSAPVDLLIRIDLQGTNDRPQITQGSVLTGSSREDGQTFASGQLEAQDADQGAQLHWQVDTVHGQYGELTLDAATGQWQYHLDNDRGATQGLAEGELATESFLASVVDEYGATSSARLNITIIGLNDDPIIGRIDSLQATQDGDSIQGLVTATDVDTLDQLSFNTTADVPGFILAADGSYRFDPSNSAYRYLAEGDTRQLVIPVTVSDGHGGTATQNLVINLTGSNDLPVLNTLVARTAAEGDALLTGQLNASDVDDGHSLTFGTAAEVDGFTLNPDGSYSFDPAHSTYRSLPAGAQQTLVIPLTVTDEHGGSATQNLVITVTGTNQGAVISGALSGTVSDDNTSSTDLLETGGQLTISDPDSGETRFSPHGASDALAGRYGVLTLDASGAWHYAADSKQAAVRRLGQGDTLTDHFTITSVDGTQQNIDVTLTGTNDVPVISHDSITSGSILEDVTQNTVTGVLVANDVDIGSQLSWSLEPIEGTFGTLSIDSLSGEWIYTLDNSRPVTQALAEGQQVTEHFTALVTDEHGAVAQQHIDISVRGTNDNPVLLQIPAQNLTEDDTVVYGQLVGTDVDTGDTLSYATTSFTPGFNLNADGSYSFDPGDAAYQHLAEGAQQILTIPVTVTDSHGATATQNLLITLTGSNDLPVMNVHAGENAAEGDGPITGYATATDIDTGDVLTYSTSANVDGFSIDPDGTYHFDPSNAAYQSLNAGATLTLSIALTVTDNHGGTATQMLTITLTGTNQGAVIAGVNSASVIEDQCATGQLETGGQLSISDPDRDEAQFVAHDGTSPLLGTYGSLTLDASGAWHYTADNNQIAIQRLGEGAQVSDHFTVTSTDGTQHQISVTLIGTNDVPVLNAIAAQSADEDGARVFGQLVGTDVDTGDTLIYSSTASVAGLTLNADGSYSFNPGDAAYQHLAEGARQVLTIPLTVTDSHGATATQNLVITITGSNDLPVMSVLTARTSTEDDAAITGYATATDIDTGDVLTYSTSADVDGFSIDPDGTYHFDPSNAAYQSLNAGATLTLSIPLTVTDNHGGSVTQTLIISLSGTNDVPVISQSSITTGAITEDATANTVVGALSASDVDNGSQLNWSLVSASGVYGSLAIDEDSGQWTYTLDNSRPATQGLAQGQQVSEHFSVLVTDEHGASARQDVVISVRGTNDNPVLLNVPSQNVLEGGAVVHGQLNATDVDTRDILSFSTSAQVPGFTLSANGAYSFDPSNAAYQHLVDGATQTLNIPVSVNDGNGGTATQILSITLIGTNQGAVIAGRDTGGVTEDFDSPGTHLLEAAGQLTISDPDSDQAVFTEYSGAAALTGSYGSLSIDASGAWHYSADNNQAAVQQLGQGATLSEHFTITSVDGTPHTVTITLNGTNDVPVLNAITAQNAVEDGAKVTGQLTATDIDTGDTLSYSATATVAGFTLNANGSYSFNPGDAAYQHLAAGAQHVLTIAVTVTDNHGATATQNLVITITGSNDLPVMSVLAARTATEGGVAITGQAVATDIDTGDVLIYSTSATVDGFSIDPDGTYHFDPSNAAYQSLNAGAKQILSIPLTVTDNHGATATKILTITLTGTNQGAAIAGVDSGGVTEDLVTSGHLLETGGQLTISDVDKGEAAFTPHTGTGALAGTYGSLTIDASGAWHYSADNNLAAVQKLSEGATVTDTFTVRSVDGTAHQITVTLLGTNDAPQIGPSSVLIGAVTEDAAVRTATGLLVASDVDSDARLSWSLTSTEGSYGTLALDAASGSWIYTLDNSRAATQALAAGQQVHDSFIATVTDNHGAITQRTVDIVISGTNDLPVISGSSTAAVTEDDLQSAVCGTLTHADPDTGDTFTWSLVNGGGTYGTLTFDTSTGTWNYSLDNSRAATQALAVGERHTDNFTVRGTDASGTPVNQVISIEVNGSNDNPAISGAHQGSVVEDRTMTASGALSFNDIDTGDKLGTWQVLTPQGIYGTLSIDQNGNWTYRLDVARSQSIKAGDTPQDSFIVRVTDNHGGHADQQVTLQVTGTNDGPAIDPNSPALTGDVTEDQIGSTTAQGTIASGDPDIGDTLTWSIDGYSGQSVGSYGTLTLDQNGHWTYTLDHDKADRLAEGATVVDRFVVNITDAAGERSSATIQVQVHGTNDGPYIGGTSSGEVTEDIATRVSGKLLPGDVDIGDTASWAIIGEPHGQLGTLTLNAQGVWTYQLDTGSASVDALGQGASATETFRVQVTDPHGATDFKDITITVHGHNDAPFISGVDSGDVTEDQQNSVTGRLCVNDVDSGDQSSFEQSQYAGTYGHFSLNTDGQWTYQLFDSQAYVQALAEGQSVTETFTIAAHDQNGGVTYQPVTITVHGTNDAPVISGVTTGVVFEYVSHTASGRLVGYDPDQGDTNTWSLSDGQGTFGTLTLDDHGRWTYTLDVNDADTKALQPGDQATDSFRVLLTDNQGVSVECFVNVSVVGTQAPDAPPDPGTGGGDTGTPPLTLPSVSVSVTEDVSLIRSGLLTGVSPIGCPVTWQVTPVNGTFGVLTLGPDGAWVYNLHNDAAQVQALNEGQSVQEYFNVNGVDASGNKVQTQFTVTINGTNDTPQIIGVLQGTTIEDQQFTASGSLAVQDLNTGDSTTWSVQDGKGQLGDFSIDNNGDWSYHLDNAKAQYLNAGESVVERFWVNVIDNHNGTSSREVVVTVYGTADGPMIPSVTDGIAVPGGKETLAGKIPVLDPDISETFSFSLVSSSQGQFGTLSIDPDGSWHYQLDQADANSALKSLAAGQQLTDTFTVQVRDGNGHMALEQIRLRVSGINDAPVINGATTGSVTDRSIIQTSGKLLAGDPDAGDVATVNPQSVDSAHGHFEVASDGAWIYTLNVLNPAVKALNAGDSLTETFHVTAVDGNGVSAGKDVIITIRGSNDLPVVGGDVRGSTTEDTTSNSHGQLTTNDVDTGDITQWTGMNTAGAYGHFVMYANGTWNYLLNGNSPQVQALKDGQVVSETFIAHGRDQHGGEVTQVITIDVHGTNDAASITGQRTGDLTEDQDVTNGQLVVSGQIHLTDVDTGEGIINAQTVQGAYGTLELHGDGTWRYSADNAQDAIQHLGQGATLTDNVSLTSADGTPYQISIMVHGTNDVPVLSVLTAQNAIEEGARVTGQLLGTDTDTGDTLIYSSTLSVAGFTLNADGSYSFDPTDTAWQHLAEGATQVLTIPIIVTDSQGATATQNLVITITGSNDLPVMSVLTARTITEGDAAITGHATATDVDTGDSLTYSSNATVDGFTIDPDGTYHFDPSNAAYQSLNAGATLTLSIPLTVTDNHGASTTQILTITLTGTNQGAVIAGVDSGSVIEDQSVTGQLETGGQLTVSDPDSDEAQFVAHGGSSPLLGTFGSLTLDASGAWHYTADNSQIAIQQLGEGAQVSDYFTVSSTDGTQHQISVTLIGTNDVPLLNAISAQDAMEEGAMVTGQLLGTDIDTGDTLIYSTSASVAGFTLNADGSYSFDPADAAWQHLAEGATQVLTIAMTVTDSQGAAATQDLIITLTGTNQAAVIAGVDIGNVQKEGYTDTPHLLETNGQLTISDPDDNGASFVAHNGADALVGSYGLLDIDASGAWHYSADNNQAAVQQLAEGEQLTEHFSVSSVDGTTHNVTITLTGLNDVPNLSVMSAAAVNDAPSVSGHMANMAVEPSTVDNPPAEHQDSPDGTAQQASAGDAAHATTAQPSTVDLYLQFAQTDADHLAGLDRHSDSTSAQHGDNSARSSVEEYLQLGGVDAAHLSHPDPALSLDHQPPPDSPLHPDAATPELTDTGHHDAHLADAPMPDPDPQYHG
ncbi:VCBS domain-containing protein [Pseudomonas sp. P8_241]|uniref:VCBS domain-containing protein n=1 Tax=Pseudomonas sp. P8_241 TaxID=3043445 RepID=UPI002A3726C0|nr:VCBS domain-containing protein [Pseudomonas sp. P8_241]WPN44545.1 VCBS domain-containing protein [Pseudomonas sp. P8_241]